nr:DNA polymerase IV [uncultured Deefgea sp.]
MLIQRKIIHIDCDCFYAAVEMRDHPEWRDVPLAVGGASDRRGVLCTSNYPARQLGIRAAMSTYRAQQLCRNLIIVPPDFPRYKAASMAMRAIFADYTDVIEPLSLDEAYLDVSGQPHCEGSASRMATEIRARIEREIGITASAGIAPNKLLAKIASDWNKPNGQFVIRPQDISEFMPNLPARKLWGIGKVTSERLAKRGIHTCADIQARPLDQLIAEWGRLGTQLYEQAQGIDHRPVAMAERRKSLSVENTYAHDLNSPQDCQNALPALYQDWQARMRRASGERAHKAFIKIKFADFTQTTVECVCAEPSLNVYLGLLEQGLKRNAQAVRLLGVGVRFNESPTTPQQLCLW